MTEYYVASDLASRSSEYEGPITDRTSADLCGWADLVEAVVVSDDDAVSRIATRVNNETGMT